MKIQFIKGNAFLYGDKEIQKFLIEHKKILESQSAPTFWDRRRGEFRTRINGLNISVRKRRIAHDEFNVDAWTDNMEEHQAEYFRFKYIEE